MADLSRIRSSLLYIPLSMQVKFSPVHSIEVLAKEDRELHADDVDDGEHVGEGHVGNEQEKRPVDAHYAFFCQFLTKVDCAQYKSNYLQNNTTVG